MGLALEEYPWDPYGDEDSPEALLRQCANMDDAQAWDKLVDRFRPLIVATVVRTMRRYGFDSAGLRDDLVQDVYLKFCANQAKVLREFQPRYPGAVFGYVSVIAANVVHDHFKSKGGKHPEPCPLPADLAVPSETEWRLLILDIENVFEREHTSARDRQIFWLYYRQGMSAKQIAAISSLKLTTKGVEAVIVRLKDLIRKALKNGKR
jgi:RNA polymerase sigma-70 factor (ECF subfamily)